VASLGFQVMLRRPRWESLGRDLWAAADVLLFTFLVVVYDGLHTSLVSGYFLLVAASGLWFLERTVWLTTAFSVLAYGALVLNEGLTAQIEPGSPYRHVIFATVLAVAGLIVAYQIRRVRALSQYYDRQPLRTQPISRVS
jgi:serine/threonine-protein kinase